MFNNLAYIPMVLAYTFITLLLVILGFIVIYVSHKIYTILYDNLPVVELSEKSQQHDDSMTKSLDKLQLSHSKTDGQVNRKSKTALRIIVNLEPCYLAYVKFEPIELHSQTIADPLSRLYITSNNCATSNRSNSLLKRDTEKSVGSENFFYKYFNSLSAIPTARELKSCENFEFNNVCTFRRNK